ncbi:MAG: response regulator transcription factor [Bacteroidota bacterium]
MIHLLLADHHALFRESLQRDLVSEPDMKVVAQSDDAEETVGLLGHKLIDVVLLDVQLAGKERLEIAEQILEICPATEVLILGFQLEEGVLEQAQKLGVAGIVSKGARQEALLDLIRKVYRGLDEFAILPAADTPVLLTEKNQLPPLAFTFTERIVLQLLAEGFGPQQIAQQLGHRLHTIEVHRRNLLAKLGVLKDGDLIQQAVHLGLIAGKWEASEEK